MSLSYRLLLLFTALYLSFAAASYAQGSKSTCSVTQNGVTLSWHRIEKTAALKLPVKKGKVKLPKRYTVFTTDAGSLHAILTAAKNTKEQTHIVLPLSDITGCAGFKVETSGTMSPELAAKYPQLASLKGQGTEDKSASVRLDYDGKEMNAEILWKGTYYIIAPWKKGIRTYYLVYRKEDSGMPRSIPAKGQYY